MDKKTVRFEDSVNDTVTTEQCTCCSHRNIKPKVRKYCWCLSCGLQVCNSCMTSWGICLMCDPSED